MSTELQMLVFASLLCLVQALPYLVGVIVSGGLGVAAGNRDDVPPLPGWAERGGRAHRNMLENLPVFAVLVLAVHLTGVADEETAFGATLFFWSRAAYALIYVAGIPYVRTVAFIASLSGLFDLVRALF